MMTISFKLFMMQSASSGLMRKYLTQMVFTQIPLLLRGYWSLKVPKVHENFLLVYRKKATLIL